MASALKEIAAKAGVGLVYKTSFDKANRTSANSVRGLGNRTGASHLCEIRERIGVPVLTDVHEREQCALIAEAVDVLQIPAFLCRQTDLLVAAAQTGRVVNVKKGQFLAPWTWKNVVAKLTGAGNPNVLVTERGVSFGYNTLVSDMRALPSLPRSVRRWCSMPPIRCSNPAAGHKLRRRARNGPCARPRGCRNRRGGGLHGTHQDPDSAPSDGPNMLKLKDCRRFLLNWLRSIGSPSGVPRFHHDHRTLVARCGGLLGFVQIVLQAQSMNMQRGYRGTRASR